MINVKGTIFSTLKGAFNRMRLFAENKPELLKKILFLIVLDDIYDWSDYLDEKQAVLKRLQDLRTNFILCNSDFDICRFPFSQCYVNVNTPQTNETWKRVWDAPELITIEDPVQPYIPTPVPIPYVPDPTCPVSVVYFGAEEKIPADENGKPYIDVTLLTTCEKMNIYINRETGQMFFLDPITGTWITIKGDTSNITWDAIIGKPNVPGGIEHYVVDDQLRVVLQDAERDEHGQWIYNKQSDTPVTDSNPDPDTNDDLKYVL